MYIIIYASGNTLFCIKKARGGPAQKGMTMLLFCSNTQELLNYHVSTLKAEKQTKQKKTYAFTHMT